MKKTKLFVILIVTTILLFLATISAGNICKLSKKTNVTIAGSDKACDNNPFNDILIGYDFVTDIFKRNF